MVVYASKSDKKKHVLELRRRGLSYSEIREAIPIPKSTLSSWLRGITLPKIHQERLFQRRLKAARHGARKRKEMRIQQTLEIQRSAGKNIKDISPRELWLIGIAFYWACGSRIKNKNAYDGVRFRSSDPDLVRIFLRWLIDIGKIAKEDIVCDIFINEAERRSRSRIVYEWSQITNFPSHHFSRIYFLKNQQKRNLGEEKKKHIGLLQIRVRASSLLNRQIDGWIHGMGEKIFKTRGTDIGKLSSMRSDGEDGLGDSQ